MVQIYKKEDRDKFKYLEPGERFKVIANGVEYDAELLRRYQDTPDYVVLYIHGLLDECEWTVKPVVEN
jgi:hypothetical protein